MWPQENVILLEKYRRWLRANLFSHDCIDQIYIPMAGHALGLNLKPHGQLDLALDLERAVAYVQAKGLSDAWTNNCRHALKHFHRFLSLERGLVPLSQPAPLNLSRYQAGLPHWLISQLTRYQRLRQAGWRPHRLRQVTIGFWHKHTRLWRWLLAQPELAPLAEAADLRLIKCAHIDAFIDAELAQGYAPKSINVNLHCFQATLRFLQERDFFVPQALLRRRGLKAAKPLPRFLTDEQVARLQADLEARVGAAHTAVKRYDALLDRAAFYLLWQGGLRLGEVEELRLNHLNLGRRQIMVRRGKGLRERAVYLTETALAALHAYLTVRPDSDWDHIFLYRHKPVGPGLIRNRIKAAGKRVGVKVSPHRLRHTYATQLVNAGCRITSIQALMGHYQLGTTMVYANVHNKTVSDDYFTAMKAIEQKLQPVLGPESKAESAPEPDTPSLVVTQPETAVCPGENGTGYKNGNAQCQALKLVDQLSQSGLNPEQQWLVAQLRLILKQQNVKVLPVNGTGGQVAAPVLPP